MELLDFPEEILLEICSNLDQKTVKLTAALVCKRFLQLTRSPQLSKCVYYLSHLPTGVDIDHQPTGVDLSGNKFQSLLVMLRDNKHLKKLKLHGDLNVLEILKVVAPHVQWYE
jgi:hypothetical protein